MCGSCACTTCRGGHPAVRAWATDPAHPGVAHGALEYAVWSDKAAQAYPVPPWARGGRSGDGTGRVFWSVSFVCSVCGSSDVCLCAALMLRVWSRSAARAVCRAGGRCGCGHRYTTCGVVVATGTLPAVWLWPQVHYLRRVQWGVQVSVAVIKHQLSCFATVSLHLRMHRPVSYICIYDYKDIDTSGTRDRLKPSSAACCRTPWWLDIMR